MKRKWNLSYISSKGILFFSIFIFGCINQSNKDNKGDFPNVEYHPVLIEYANQFSISYHKNYKIVDLIDEGETKTYVLSNKKDNVPDSLSTFPFIRIPVQKIASTSISHLPFFDLLKVDHTLNAFANTKYIHNDKFLQKVKDSSIIEIGDGNDVNFEKTVIANPELLLTFPSASKKYDELEKAGIQCMEIICYKENSPLGRTEWIKLFGALFNKEQQADSIFNKIKNQYNAVKANIETSFYSVPKTFMHKPYKSIWHMPSGNSLVAKFIKDAGGDYLWKNDTLNSPSIPLAFETVFEKAYEASFWLFIDDIPNSYESLSNEDSRYQEFTAYKEDQIYFCNATETDYFGQGIVEPHIILSDLIMIFHPDLIQNHTPVYFKNLD